MENLNTIIIQKKEKGTWNSRKIIRFLSKYLPKKILISGKLSLQTFNSKPGRIFLIMKLLKQEADYLDEVKDGELIKRIFSLCSNLSKQAKDYATH